MAGLLVLSLLATACGDDGDGEEDTMAAGSTSSSTAPGDELPSCDAVDHTVIFGFFGTVTRGEPGELLAWADDAGAAPEPRPGAADVAHAYRELGYNVVYVTAEPSTTDIDGQPMAEAITVWLGANRFPIDEGTRVWAWNGNGEMSVALIQELTDMTTSGVDIHAGYASDPDVVFPLSTGGIPSTNLFTVGDAAQDGTSTSLPEEDLGAHLSDVRDLDPVCE
jgi:hypothetical protein